MTEQNTAEPKKIVKKIDQRDIQSFETLCGKAKIYVETDMAIGIFHDFLMHVKGVMVERMIEAHKQQMIEAQHNIITEQSDIPTDSGCTPCEG